MSQAIRARKLRSLFELEQPSSLLGKISFGVIVIPTSIIGFALEALVLRKDKVSKDIFVPFEVVFDLRQRFVHARLCSFWGYHIRLQWSVRRETVHFLISLW